MNVCLESMLEEEKPEPKALATSDDTTEAVLDALPEDALKPLEAELPNDEAFAVSEMPKSIPSPERERATEVPQSPEHKFLAAEVQSGDAAEASSTDTDISKTQEETKEEDTTGNDEEKEVGDEEESASPEPTRATCVARALDEMAQEENDVTPDSTEPTEDPEQLDSALSKESECLARNNAPENELDEVDDDNYYSNDFDDADGTQLDISQDQIIQDTRLDKTMKVDTGREGESREELIMEVTRRALASEETPGSLTGEHMVKGIDRQTIVDSNSNEETVMDEACTHSGETHQQGEGDQEQNSERTRGAEVAAETYSEPEERNYPQINEQDGPVKRATNVEVDIAERSNAADKEEFKDGKSVMNAIALEENEPNQADLDQKCNEATLECDSASRIGSATGAATIDVRFGAEVDVAEGTDAMATTCIWLCPSCGFCNEVCPDACVLCDAQRPVRSC